MLANARRLGIVPPVMGHPSICVPGAPRRRSKWYVKLRRGKHLYVWVALLVALVLLFGYSAMRLVKRSMNAETNPKYQIKLRTLHKEH